MICIFLPPEELSAEEVIIAGDQAKHLSVLRVKIGEIITVFDGLGCKYDCKILQINKKAFIAEKLNKAPYSAESPISITLAQGIAKGEKMDFIIQKATELGVNKIIPLITERSQVRHTAKIERWRKIALSAAEQSCRGKVPEINEPVSFNGFLEGRHIGIIFYEQVTGKHLKQTLKEFNNSREITLLIGPEGGFSKEEVNAAIEQGFMEASLGPRILRTETAAINAISIIQYELGDAE
ncbi:MAG: 16S rRNA (uracil(1498)-N(3))-methyltransferase [Nitrospirae bacterium]|nr:16S rRNA (uracil(1498)-N(3))-methyltransferase [Nitrospirota bacterium]